MKCSTSGSFVLLMMVCLAGCGDGPPSAKTKEAIDTAVINGRPGVEVSSYKLDGWKPGQVEKEFETPFTAKLKLKEPVGMVMAEVNGKNIVRIVAQEGEELTFTGRAHAIKMNDGWHVDAFADAGETKSGWTELDTKAGPITMGYQVVGNPTKQTAFRQTMGFGPGSALVPLSQMQPCVVEGTPEMKALETQLREQAKQAQQAAIDRQHKAQEVQAEKQHQLEVAKQNLLDEQKKKEEDARLVRLLPLLQPFKAKPGVAVLTGADLSMSALLTEIQLDEKALTVKGKGLDLREMPFKEFTFDGAVSDRGLSFTSPLSAKPLGFGAPSDRGLAGAAGTSISVLAEADRARLDNIIAQAAQLASATPIMLQAEALDAVAVKSRQAGFQFAPLPGAVLFHGKNAAAFAPLFAGDPAGKKAYSWKKEALGVRLTKSVRGKGLYILCSTVPIDHLSVVINGVHRAMVDAVAKNGAAIITLPADLDVLDLRFEVEGSASARGIMLIR